MYARCMVIRMLLRRKRWNEQAQLHGESFACFYCKQDEPDRRDPAKILNSILKQLCVSSVGDELPKDVVKEYNKRAWDGFASGSLTLSECQALILLLLKKYPRTTIVLDALDETEPATRRELLNSIEAMTKSSNGLVKLFVSSRDDMDIKLKLRGIPNVYIRPQDNMTDIFNFINREINAAIAGRRLLSGEVSDSLKEAIVSALQEKAKGM